MIEKGPKNNAREAEDCCYNIYSDDGRWVDPKYEGDHKGDWGSHSRADTIGQQNTDYGEAYLPEDER